MCVQLCAYVCMLVTAYTCVYTWLRCYAHEWHVGAWGIVLLKCPFGLSVETGSLTGLELTKLSWLRSQQEVQIHTSPPLQHWNSSAWNNTRALSLSWLLSIGLSASCSPLSPKSSSNETILFKEKKLPWMPTRRLHSHRSSTCIVLGTARDSRHLPF